MRKPDAHRRNHRSVHLLATVIALAALATFALVSAAFGQAPQSAPPAASAAALRGNAQVADRHRRRSRPAGSQVASFALRSRGSRPARRAPAGVDMVGREGIRIEILHSLGAGALSELVGRLGGSRLRPVDATTAEAVVPYDELEALEAAPGVSFGLPLPAARRRHGPGADQALRRQCPRPACREDERVNLAFERSRRRRRQSRDHRLLLAWGVECGNRLRRPARPGRGLLHQRRGSLRLLVGQRKHPRGRGRRDHPRHGTERLALPGAGELRR